ncbi:hypothetical protein LTR70_009190 [Exophiala xenobiotica]|uniref:NB-ARC domain-containing protein n=1 Tax=Lithohypha guttulata TaxID=1690604 RepID=A0ABR0JY46_9EURO|nr:hypothetical protein LTR24_009193 [Lithohypha guttulata]KAK5310845.1 hypothetical protein LTR70_009190 [Exophiala xenobiotica]
MVHAWLSDKHNGRWTMVVDNADSYEVMFGSRSGEARTSTVFSTSSSAMASSDRSLSNYLPSSAQGAIVITTRSREVAKGLIECAEDIVDVVPMTSEDKIRETIRLLQELDYMPLAITQAAAYINQLGSRMTLSRYVEMLAKSDLDRERLLKKDIRDS